MCMDHVWVSGAPGSKPSRAAGSLPSPGDAFPPMVEGHWPPPAAGLCQHTEMPGGTFLFVRDQIFMAQTRDTAKGTFGAGVKGPELCHGGERPSHRHRSQGHMA